MYLLFVTSETSTSMMFCHILIDSLEIDKPHSYEFLGERSGVSMNFWNKSLLIKIWVLKCFLKFIEISYLMCSNIKKEIIKY